MFASRVTRSTVKQLSHEKHNHRKGLEVPASQHVFVFVRWIATAANAIVSFCGFSLSP